MVSVNERVVANLHRVAAPISHRATFHAGGPPFPWDSNEANFYLG